MHKREAKTDDAGAMAALHAVCFGQEAWHANQIEGSLSLITTRSCVLLDEERLVGFYLVQTTGEESEILTICVDPAQRRHGLGQGLVQEILTSQKTGRVFLEVAADNVAGIALYEKCGFIRLGWRWAYYEHAGKKLDALTYHCLVNGEGL